MADHYEKATEQLTHASVLKADLSRHYAKPADERDMKEVGRISAKVRAAVKLAEVHALLAIAQRMDDLGLRR